MSGVALSTDGTRWRVMVPGLGTRAWHTDEPEAPGLHALCGNDGDVPHEGAPVSIAVYDALNATDVPVLIRAERFADENALRDWYERHVGHRAEGSPLPELLQLVAGALIFQVYNDEGDNKCP